MPTPTPYFIILSRRGLGWYPCVEFTTSGDRNMFQAIAERLVTQFQGEVVERYGGVGPGDKEYWWIDIASKRQLLMRKGAPIGIGLIGNDLSDIELFVRIAEHFGARLIGWRWKLLRTFRR